MIYGILPALIGLIALLIAVFEDIRIREVPDWLNFSLIAFGVFYAGFLSIYYSSVSFLINAGLGLLVGILFGFFMFYSGQWGGGDTKMLFGLSVIIGLSIGEFQEGIPTLFVFLINIMLVGAVFGLLFSIYKAISNFQKFKSEAIDRLSTRRAFWVRLMLVVLGGFALILFFVIKSSDSWVFLALILFATVFFYIWIFITSVEKACMIREIPVTALTEGDWVVNEIKKGKKVILKPSKTGITNDEILLLKKSKITRVVVKVGMPFIPSFLVAYVLLLLLGNWITMLF